MFAGSEDDYMHLDDVRNLKEQLAHTLVHYHEFDATHNSFMIGKDMSYFDQVKELVNKYNQTD